MPRRRALIAALLVVLAAVPAAVAHAGWTGPFARISSNPADKLAALPIEAGGYDRARGCTRKSPAPGARSLARWLDRTTAGTSWGVVRCERWGRGSASLHAEGRALDWHLDAGRPRERRAARRLIALLLAPDRKGRRAALARRMGIQEIIFDCRAWFGGEAVLRPYSACEGERVDRTTAHRDHIHLGLTQDGAAKRTSFWTRRSPAPRKREGWVPPAPAPLDDPLDGGPWQPDEDEDEVWDMGDGVADQVPEGDAAPIDG